MLTSTLDTLTPATAAAFWSAVAASFAALASLFIMLIQRRSLLESVRPELVLTGWSRAAYGEGDSVHEIVKFEAIKNIGRGAALHVYVNSMQEVDRRPTAVLSTKRLPILAANETSDINGEIYLWWKNVQPDKEGHKYLPFMIQILCWDPRGVRHETNYSFLAVELNQPIFLSDEIAPGVALNTRTTVSKPIWLLKLRAKLALIPGLQWLS